MVYRGGSAYQLSPTATFYGCALLATTRATCQRCRVRAATGQSVWAATGCSAASGSGTLDPSLFNRAHCTVARDVRSVLR